MEKEVITPDTMGPKLTLYGYSREISETGLFSKIRILSSRHADRAKDTAWHTITLEFYRGPLVLKMESAPLYTAFPDTYVEALYGYICGDVNGIYEECLDKPVLHRLYFKVNNLYFGFKIIEKDNW